MLKFKTSLALLAGLLGSAGAQAAEVASARVIPGEPAPPAAVFLYGKPMALPRPTQPIDLKAVKRKPPGQAAKQLRPPRVMKGNPGGPVLAPQQIVPDSSAVVAPSAAIPQALGESGFLFSTSRVELQDKADTSNRYPYRAVGRLGFRYNGYRASCSASLIGPGLLLTAAHCVSEFGSGKFLPDARWAFIPGYYKGKGAYGAYAAQAAYAPKSYLDGTDNCVDGVVCASDVALIVLKPNARKTYPGKMTGWLGVGLDGEGFSPFLGLFDAVPIGQLGYPGGLDKAEQMIRNDSTGFSSTFAKDETDENPVPGILLGSPLDGGSSGGPWITNLGIPPVYNGVNEPMLSTPNVVVGVTSWGIDDKGATALQGSSVMTSDNLGALMDKACTDYPAACAPR